MMNNIQTTLSVQNLDVYLSEKKILNDINLDIPKGKLYSLLGDSGSGKSTLLKTIVGIYQQQRGSIYLNNRCIDRMTMNKRNISMIFQDLRLFPHLNVLENISFSLKMQGFSKKIQLEKSMQMIKQVKLDGFEKRQPNQLSGGQQQRVALARSLVHEPEVLLLDEPFSSLDSNLREEMGRLLQQLHQTSDVTMILVTHDPQEACKLSDCIAIMKNGCIIQVDTPDNILHHPKTFDIATWFIEGNQVQGKVVEGFFCSDLFSMETDRKDGEYIAIIPSRAIELLFDKEIKSKIEKCDYTGNYYNVYINCGSTTLSVFSNKQYAIGTPVRLNFDKEKILLYDKN